MAAQGRRGIATPPAHVKVHETDVLVLGAGLAGLRAGIAALEEPRGGHDGRPGASPVAAPPSITARRAGPEVLCCALGRGPAGSSFANENDALGMLVPRDDDECRLLAKSVMALSRPGFADPQLVALMAAEALARFEDLQRWGVPFQPEADAATVLRNRVPGCFLPGQRLAAIFRNLSRAHAALVAQFHRLGGRLQQGVAVLDLASSESSGRRTVQGALLQFPDEPAPRFVAARSVVLALGGPAPLFARNVCGPAVSGWSLALLRRAGAVCANEGFLQFMWHSLSPKRFFPLQMPARRGWEVLDPERERWTPIPDSLRQLAGQREGHCPFGYGLEDAALDRFLLERRDDAGIARLRAPGEADLLEIAAMAHAGNGGAVIDEHGRTSVPGLYACGECATGMHGANRIGGGMVLATQVFGARAGAMAAREAAARPAPPWLRSCGEPWREDPPPAAHTVGALKRELSLHAVCGGTPDMLPGLLARIREPQLAPLHGEDRLQLESMQIVVEALCAHHGLTEAP